MANALDRYGIWVWTSKPVPGLRQHGQQHDAFVQQQRDRLDEVFALTEGEDALRAHFERMALETYAHLTAAGAFVAPFSIEADSASNFANRGGADHKLVPADLLQRWLDWRLEYHGLLGRNPRLEVFVLLHAISESHDASSWPCDWEAAISDWIDKGEREFPPFDDRHGLVTPEFYEHLRNLRSRAGGFLFWSDEARRVVFLPEPEWQQEAAAQERRHAEWQSRWSKSRGPAEQPARTDDAPTVTPMHKS